MALSRMPSGKLRVAKVVLHFAYETALTRAAGQRGPVVLLGLFTDAAPQLKKKVFSGKAFAK